MMRRVQKFLALSWTERWLLTRAVFVVGSIRLALWMLPFRTLRALLARLGPVPVRALDSEPTHDAERVAWAVSAAARYVPHATCLTRALAAQHLLARCGEPSELHIGARTAERGITAHAWLAAGGRVVIGAETMERYLPLTWLARREG